MNYTAPELRQIPLRHEIYRNSVRDLLSKNGLTYDTALECYIGVYMDGQLMGGAGYSGKIIQCVAIDESLRGLGVTNTLISELLRRIYENGHSNAMLFTKPGNQALFEGAGLRLVESSDTAMLMETDPKAFANYLGSLSGAKESGFSASIVMNCNPFTLGHQYLIEYAAGHCDTLHIFLVQEDKSVFPFRQRLELLQKGTSHLGNVRVHPGGSYIISSATFPTYFIKSADEAIKSQAELDLRIFARHIAEALNIKKRFVGEEPYCPVTSVYNQIMERTLPPMGIEVEIVPRKELDREAISASLVRELINKGRLEKTRGLLPDSTYDFLHSEEAAPIIERIKSGIGRH